MKCFSSYFLLLLLLRFPVFGQNLDSLYKQADNFGRKYSSKFYYNPADVRAVEGKNLFTYITQTSKGTKFLLINIDDKTTNQAFDQEKTAVALSEKLNRKVEAYNLPFRRFTYSENLDSIFFQVDNAGYSLSLNSYELSERRGQSARRESYWGRSNRENSDRRVISPDKKFEAYISEGNLWIRNLETKKAEKLSFDGSPYEYYSSAIYWSPDSKKLVSCKFRPVETRKLLLISSSPKDRLQPTTEEFDYTKPGDALPVRSPVAFNIETKEVIRFTVPDVENQYYLGNIKWDKSSRYFTFDFNKRGHGQFVIYAGDVVSKSLRTIVNEESSTFIYYNALYQYWFKEADELLWISERDGWRHLYLYDVKTGKPKKQLTKGEWIVKKVVNVDEKARKLIFVGCGMDKNEDPYLEKYYSLNIDNGKITPLTPEKANHRVTFTTDYRFMFDVYSRVDLPPTVVVRSVDEGGKIVIKPENQPFISEVTAAGWRMPEVFSAKGRDGTTDIWGVIIRPSNFDPSVKYPVIEYIYAGPHDSHVPKNFAIVHTPSALAELGFITVMIDGMGTANRSKAFHDVCWKNLKDAGFPDRIAWIKSAAEKYPEMDISKVGIYGTSAGGQSAMGGLLFYPDFYKVGVSSCGCHDNRMDKIWWNEQWMGYPIGKEYEESSNVVNAHLLKGDLMLILGELDNNVDPSSTLQVVDQLIKHDKEFEFVMLPGERHTSGGKYGERKRRDFFVKHLLGKNTPEWNDSKK
ncbi:MAG: prolyl oligopeptidase family serine peptidase [Porphyromonadaceae bacterium]|nr:prolyl oligopeptidase family serine peptidase [Porphyromonadaceae bacterium]